MKINVSSRSGICTTRKEMVVAPYSIQNILAPEHLITIFEQKSQKNGFTVGKILLNIAKNQFLIPCYECKQAKPDQLIFRFPPGLDLAAFQKNFNFKYQFLNAEWLCNIIIATLLQTVNLILMR